MVWTRPRHRAKAAATDADDELFERRQEDYKWFETVDENPLDYVEPFPFLRLSRGPPAERARLRSRRRGRARGAKPAMEC